MKLPIDKICTTFFLVTIIFITSCSISRKSYESKYQLYLPPNCIRVSSNLFCDQTEISNFQWMEYCFWMQKVYGSTSKEYLGTLPDTAVWSKSISCLNSFARIYYDHPAYQDYPVVGLSQQQVIEYSRWRSDRVFEMLLIYLKKIEWDTAQTKETHFTISRYFNGELKNIIPDEKLNYYPNFRLPTLEERQMILKYSDSVDNSYYKKCYSIACKNCKISYLNFRSDIVPCVNDSFKFVPTICILSGCSIRIYNLRGNVGEWLSISNVSAGGGWIDNRTKILEDDTFHISTVNAWTGFRNVCEWKKWRE